jgi:hypothetical protein
MDLITEIYQLLFTSSIIFIGYVLGMLLIKMYGRFALKSETRFVLSKGEKIMLWTSLAIFFTYLI